VGTWRFIGDVDNHRVQSQQVENNHFVCDNDNGSTNVPCSKMRYWSNDSDCKVSINQIKST